MGLKNIQVLKKKEQLELINKIYLTILKFSLGIIFSIVFFGAGKSNLFKRKIIPINTIVIKNNFINNPIILLL